MYCEKCGKKLPEDAAFCPGCGTKTDVGEMREEIQERLQKKRKWIIPVSLTVVVLGIAVFLMIAFSDRSALKAYQTFYAEFYEEHAGDLDIEELDDFDCPGRIIKGSNGELLMTIMDITRASNKSGGKGVLYLYGYEWGKVVQKAELRNLRVHNRKDIGEIPVRAVAVDEELYLVGADAFSNLTYQKEEDSKKPFTLYILNEKEKKFEEVKWNEKPNARESEGFYQFETEQGISYERWEYLSGRCLAEKVSGAEVRRVRKESFADSTKIAALFSVRDEDFLELLERMQKEKLKDDIALQLFYAKMTEELDIEIPGYDYEETDAPIVTVIENEQGYYGVRTSGKLSLLRAKNAGELKDISKVLKDMDGRAVTRIEGGAFYNSKNLKQVRIPETISYIGANVFAGCEKLEWMEIPESVEQMGTDIFGSGKYGFSTTIVFCDPGSEAEVYAQKNEIPCKNGEAEEADPKEIEKIRGEIKKKNRYLSAYAEYFERNSEEFEKFRNDYDGSVVGTASYDIVDIQNDGVPELILCVTNSYAGITDFFYVGKNNQVKSYQDFYNWMSYDPNTGLIYSSTGGGHMGISEGIFQYVERIDYFEEIHTGSYQHYDYGNPEYRGMQWDGVSYPTLEAYDVKLQEFFNKDAAENPEYKEYTDEVDLMEEIYKFAK